MLNLTKRFVKYNGKYHLLTLEDIRFAKAKNRWPYDYQEINWEEEKENFISLRNFLGKTPEHNQAKELSKLSSQLGVPVIKEKVVGTDNQTINTYPKYWLEEMFSGKLNSN